MKIRALKLSPKRQRGATASLKVEPVELENKLDVFYREIGCSTIDIVARTPLKGRRLLFMVDDEGLLNLDAIMRPACITLGKDGKPVEIIVGNALVFGDGEDGELASISDRDIQAIRQSIRGYKNDLGLLREMVTLVI